MTDVDVVRELIRRVDLAWDALTSADPDKESALAAAVDELSDVITDDTGDPRTDPGTVAVARALLETEAAS